MTTHTPGISLLIAAAVLAGAACRRQAVVYTDAAQRISSVERFAGETRVRIAQANPAAVRVDVRTWTLGGGLKLDELPLPTKGLMIVQLRGGSVTTVIGGTRQTRREGDFWTVQPGMRMGLETGEDSAIVETVVVVQP